jgi:hypothetical protein
MPSLRPFENVFLNPAINPSKVLKEELPLIAKSANLSGSACSASHRLSDKPILPKNAVFEIAILDYERPELNK